MRNQRYDSWFSEVYDKLPRPLMTTINEVMEYDSIQAKMNKVMRLVESDPDAFTMVDLAYEVTGVTDILDEFDLMTIKDLTVFADLFLPALVGRSRTSKGDLCLFIMYVMFRSQLSCKRSFCPPMVGDVIHRETS